VSCALLGIENTNIVLQVYASGKVNIVGSRSLEESNRVWKEVYVNVLSTVRPTENGGVTGDGEGVFFRSSLGRGASKRNKKAGSAFDDDDNDDMDEDDEENEDGAENANVAADGPEMYGGQYMYDIRLQEALFALNNTI
jgi:hypothetical protein